MNCLALGFLSLFSLSAAAQEAREFILNPSPYRQGEFHSAGGLAMVVLPRTVVEEEIRTIPMLDYQCRYGLPAGFSVSGRVSSNYLTNFIALTPHWGYKFDRVSVGLGYGVSYWYGFVNMTGFDISAQSWLNAPNLMLGYDFIDWMLTVWFDTQIIASRSTKTDGAEVASGRNTLASYGIGVAIEQPFFGRTYSLLSFKVNYAKALYQAWLAFSTFNKYLVYPELSFALLF